MDSLPFRRDVWHVVVPACSPGLTLTLTFALTFEPRGHAVKVREVDITAAEVGTAFPSAASSIAAVTEAASARGATAFAAFCERAVDSPERPGEALPYDETVDHEQGYADKSTDDCCNFSHG